MNLLKLIINRFKSQYFDFNMTLHEAVIDYQYDVSMYYYEDEYGKGWSWDINGGYCSVSGRRRHADINGALVDLMQFLETFQPFEK